MRVLKGRIYWELVDKDSKGGRALVRPLSDPGWMAALIGKDLKTGRPFFIPVPPDIRSVDEAMDWIYNLEPGTWRRAKRKEY